MIQIEDTFQDTDLVLSAVRATMASNLRSVMSLNTQPEPRMIIIKPWDPSMLGDLERAITASSLGINPNNDGKIIRLTFPELTGDRRKALCRQVAERGEHAKVVVRNVRREYNDLFKASQKDGEVGEDELKRYLDMIQENTNQWCVRIDAAVQAKEEEILEV